LILPLIIIGYAIIFVYNPQINLDGILEPILNQIEAKLPENFPKTFVAGTFIYKFITVSISYLTGYNLNPFTGDEGSLSDEDRNNIREIINNYKDISRYSPSESLTAGEIVEYDALFPLEEDLNTPKASTSKLPLGNPPLN
jgi:hypothetical protein